MHTPQDDPSPHRPITWHTAFRDGIQLTFLPYRNVLSFEFEYPLNTEPLRIDAVIIKKEPEVVIDMPLGTAFRQVNIIEYKSPGDYLALDDYHKVGAYARLYSVLTKTKLSNMTMTFVTESYPRKLMTYLRESLKYRIEEKWPGIYQFPGGELGGAQVVVTKKLREEDGGVWLRDLRGGLKREELRWILEESKRMPAGTPMAAYLYMVVGANEVSYKELVEMSNKFDKLMEECGLAAKWEAKGRKEEQKQAVRRMQRYGMDPVEIGKVLELPLSTVFSYLKAE